MCFTPAVSAGEALSAPPRVDPPGYAGTLAVPLLTSLNIPSASGYWTTWGRGNVANGGASGGITVGPWSNPLEYQSLPNQTVRDRHLRAIAHYDSSTFFTVISCTLVWLRCPLASCNVPVHAGIDESVFIVCYCCASNTVRSITSTHVPRAQSIVLAQCCPTRPQTRSQCQSCL